MSGETGVSEVPRKRRWRTVAAAGCGCLSVAALAVAILISLNWSRLAELYHSASATMAELQGVHAVLQKEYATSQISVMAKRHSGVKGSILSIRFVNAPFAKDLTQEAAREKAREVAFLARSALASPDSYDNYEVIFTRQTGAGVTISNSRSFLIRRDELPSPNQTSK